MLWHFIWLTLMDEPTKYLKIVPAQATGLVKPILPINVLSPDSTVFIAFHFTSSLYLNQICPRISSLDVMQLQHLASLFSFTLDDED